MWQKCQNNHFFLAILYHFIHSWYIFDHQGLNIIVKTQKILNWSLEIDIETQSIQISLRRLCKLMGAATNRERLIVARVQYFLLRVVPKWTQNIFFWLKSEKITSFRLWELHKILDIHATALLEFFILWSFAIEIMLVWPQKPHLNLNYHCCTFLVITHHSKDIPHYHYLQSPKLKHYPCVGSFNSLKNVQLGNKTKLFKMLL